MNTKKVQSEGEYCDRFELAVEATQDGLWDWNIADGEVYYAEYWKKMLGFSEDEVGKSFEEWSSRVHPEDVEQMRSALDAHLEGRSELFSNEYRMLCKDGSYKWILNRAKAQRDRSGKAYRVVGFHTEITRQKSLESSLEETSEQLEEVLKQIPETVLVIDPENLRILKANRFASEVLGYSFDELRGMSINDIDVDQTPLENAMQIKAILDAKLDHIERVWRSKDGRVLHHEIKCSPVNIDGKKVVLCAARDTTKQIMMENELELFNIELRKRVEVATKKIREQEIELIQQSKMAAMGEMIGAIAHQWKQPLNIIATYSGLLTDVENREVELERIEEMINEQVQFMAETIDDFRNFFRPSKIKTPFKTSAAIESIIRILKSLFQRYSIAIEFEQCKSRSSILGFPNEFKQVVLNLLINAKDAFEEREVKKRSIVISLEYKEGLEIIRFRDNGGGIPPQLLPEKLFDAHVSTKGEKGSGIGLSLSKIIIETNMGGKIWAHNVGKGAEFVIELPVMEGT